MIQLGRPRPERKAATKPETKSVPMLSHPAQLFFGIADGQQGSASALRSFQAYVCSAIGRRS